MKRIFSMIIMMVMISVPVWAFEVNPDNVTGKKGDVINVPVKINKVYSAIEANAFGFTVEYDGNVLSFIKPDKKGSLVESFTLVEGKENSPGKAKIGGSYFTDKVFLTDGLLLNIQFKVKDDAKGTSKIELSNFKDALKGASSTTAAFILK